MEIALRILIEGAIAELDRESCPSPSTATDSLVGYAELLAKWNEKSNLVGAGSIEAIVSEHIVDSIEAWRVMPRLTQMVDVGSGAGLPGVVFACLNSGIPIELIEPRRRHASFLSEAIRRLELPAATLFEGVVEEHEVDGPPTLWCSRAFSPMENFFELLAEVVRDEDVVAFIGGLESKIDGAGPSGFVLTETLEYTKKPTSKRVFLFNRR